MLLPNFCGRCFLVAFKICGNCPDEIYIYELLLRKYYVAVYGLFQQGTSVIKQIDKCKLWLGAPAKCTSGTHPPIACCILEI